MREFKLSDVVSAFLFCSSSVISLWGLFIVATFAAAGFGASFGNRFDAGTATMLTVGYLAFAIAHWVAIRAGLQTQRVIADEVRSRLAAGPDDLTDYPMSVARILDTPTSLPVSLAVHLVIDACVVGVIWYRIV